MAPLVDRRLGGAVRKARQRLLFVIGFCICLFLVLHIAWQPTIQLPLTTNTPVVPPRTNKEGNRVPNAKHEVSVKEELTKRFEHTPTASSPTTLRGSAVCRIGKPPWDTDHLVDELDAFLDVYARRPGGMNDGGGAFFNYYALWNIVKVVSPTHIVESGAHNGVGTWFLRQAAGSKTHIIVVSPNTPNLYKDANGRYFTGPNFKDFNQIDWGFLPPETTLLFMDDHQSANRRVSEAYERGFAHMVFDDNYVPGQGDNFSVKKVCNGDAYAIVGAPFRDQDYFGQKSHLLSASEWAARRELFLSIVAVTAEFPPVWDGPNRFGLSNAKWTQITMPSILSESAALAVIREHGLDAKEARRYAHIVYVGLRQGIQQ